MLALEVKAEESVLDLCASPGGEMAPFGKKQRRWVWNFVGKPLGVSLVKQVSPSF